MRMAQIEQVLTIASEGSINKAAQKLYLSQPNISVSLRQLEEELGEAIFERTGKGVVLTSFGREFLLYAQPSYRQFKLLGVFCRSLIKEHPLTLSVASQYLRFANSLFIDICKRHESELYQFSFIEGMFQDVIGSVRSQESEVGVVVIASPQERLALHILANGGMEYHPLASNGVAVSVAKDHPLCAENRTEVKAEELQPYPMVVYRDASYDFSALWSALGIEDHGRRIMVSDRATLNELIATTDAYAVGVHNEYAYQTTQCYSNVQALRLVNNQVRMGIGYVVNRSRPLSPIAQEYIEDVRRIVQ